ncbi:MAG: tRNA 2-thiouridine(34) synthase MnmA, partial [Mogibacterium sp.]|nr:tRNA 2-thiouridine(34) synthase MnmA [Mogibacterium sp.]
DQAYFLSALSQEQLSRTLFPLGTMTKPEVREIAESLGLVTARKKDSQDICFVPDGDYAAFIQSCTGKEYPPGDFIDADGHVLGEHRGIIHYTVGQRKGLGIALGAPAYVQALDAERNRVILGSNETLFTRKLVVTNFNWVSIANPGKDFQASARIRYRHQEAPARIIPLAEDTVRVIFDEPQRAVTSGQTAVVYDGDYVLGGGTIL